MNVTENDVLAVDGDIIAYRTAAVCEEDFEGACASIIDSTLKEISTSTGVNNMRIYLSGRDNFRYAVGKTKPYKGNRATMVRPRFLDYCKKYLVEKYKAFECHGYEADDGIATDMTINGAIHCGIDKDILQIAGRHYNYVNKEWQEVDEEQAVITLYRQVLMGDASDNVPGLPRVGAKTAEKIILDPITAHDDAIAYYHEVCSDKMPDVNPDEYFNEQFSLIQMVTSANVTFDHTVFVEPNTEGFAAQAGEFTEVENFDKKEVRL